MGSTELGAAHIPMPSGTKARYSEHEDFGCSLLRWWIWGGEELESGTAPDTFGGYRSMRYTQAFAT
jgi:hypothetical protein